MLKEILKKLQAGDDQCLLKIIDQFKMLLRRYARLLKYEDAYNDLTIDFIQLVQQMDISAFDGRDDGAVVNYIVKSVRHIFIKLSKAYSKQCSKESFIDSLSEYERNQLEMRIASTGDEWSDFLTVLDSCTLTSNERETLILEFYWGFSSAEIAQRQVKSRQSVNQTKSRALKKLRQTIE